MGQIDSAYVSKLNNKYTYKYPLIVQLFPETENMKNWYKIYILFILNKLIIKILNLDKSPDAWYIMYFLYKNYILILLTLLILFIVIFILKFNK